jgi:hypothetical protein
MILTTYVGKTSSFTGINGNNPNCAYAILGIAITVAKTKDAKTNVTILEVNNKWFVVALLNSRKRITTLAIKFCVKADLFA